MSITASNILHYGAQYMHHKDNDLYRWAVQDGLINDADVSVRLKQKTLTILQPSTDTDCETQENSVDETYNFSIGRGQEIPPELTAAMWSVVDMDDQDLQDLLEKYKTRDGGHPSMGEMWTRHLKEELSKTGHERYLQQAVSVCRSRHEGWTGSADWNLVCSLS
jgi:hypothetical protein